MKFNKELLSIAGLTALASNAMAETTPVDYSALTSAVSFTDVVAAMLGVGALIIGFIVIRNNFTIIKNFIKGGAK